MISSTASTPLGWISRIRFESSVCSRRTCFAPSASSAWARPLAFLVVAMTRTPISDAILMAAWPRADVAPRTTRVWPGEMARFPHKVLPRQIREQRDHIGRSDAGHLGIAAVDEPPHAAHQRRDLLARGIFAVGIGFHDADAFDAGDFGDVAPRAGPHVGLGAVEAERFHLDDDMTGLGLRLRTLFERQDFGSAVLLDDDGT